MILFSFCNAVLLTVSFSQAERELNEAVERERETTHTNEILEKMGRLRTDFMHNIAHEMKTPLAVMSGYAQLTKRQIEKNALSEETVANLTTVSNEAQRLSDMVTKLLSVSYSDVGAVELNRINIQELLEAAASVCRPILAKRNNELLISCEESTDIIANREALLQVLINLAVNACKHTQNGTVTFSTARAVSENGFVAFRIKDTGSGISEDVLPHIFDKGYSTDGGNGLGLGICKEIIESMGGVIYIEQTDKNGTTVYFTVLSGKED